MSLPDAFKIPCAQRRELRIRRDKTAAMILAVLLGKHYDDLACTKTAIEVSVDIADQLLAKLDATDPNKEPTP